MKKTKKFTLTILLVMISVLILTACTTTQSPSGEATPTGGEEVATINISHQLGDATVNKNPQKVIVFDYATLDSLDSLGVEIIGLPKSNIPAHLAKFNDEKYEDVGTLFEPNFEKIAGMQPDLILISARQAEVYEDLQKIAPTVYLAIDNNDYLGSFSNNVKVLGEIFSKETLVENELVRIAAEIESLNKKVGESGKNALIVMANDGNLNAYGAGSRFGILHKEFGFAPVDENIEVANHGMNISYEYIIEKNPDYIFVIDRAAVAGGSITAQQVFENELMKQTQAYQNDTIIYLNSHVWYVAAGGLSGTEIMINEIETAIE